MALQQLHGQRLYVLELSEHGVSATRTAYDWHRAGLSGELQYHVLEQLGTLLKAGLPLDRALAIVAELPESRQAKAMLEQVRQAVRTGGSLSSALAEASLDFSPVAVNLVRAGEAAGSLPQNLMQAASYLAQGARLRGKLLNALIYPAILMFTVVLAIGFLMTVVVPQFEALFSSLGVSLPWYTQVLLAASAALRAYGLYIVVALAGLAVWGIRYARQEAVRRVWDARALRLPILGPLWQKAEVARFCASLSVMLGQGVAMLGALAYSGAIIQNRHLRQVVDNARVAVKAGQGLSAALSQEPGFPHMALQMIQAGEESGQLPTMLAEVAAAYELQTDQASSRFLAVLVPALTLLMTAVVALVILAVLLPVYDLTGTLELS